MRVVRHLVRRLKSRFPTYLFSRIYEKRRWGKEGSASGRGSSLEQTEVVRAALPELLRRLGANSLLDIPCGDFHWMRHVDLGGIQYVGADIVSAMIERNNAEYSAADRRFVVCNILGDVLPRADVILCRDCLVHLSNRDVRAAVANIKRSGATYLVATTYPGHGENRDILTGEWRALNFERPPFCFPAPTEVINERCTEGRGQWADKSLGVWRIADLP